MVEPRPRSVLVPALLALVVGCDGEGCSGECQNAIDHMAAKIEQNACDPSRMEEARQRIDDACGASGSRHIGMLVEECNAGEGISVTAGTNVANMRIQFTVGDAVVLRDESYDVELRAIKGFGDNPFEAPILPNGAFPLDYINGHVWTGELADAETVSVRVHLRGDPEEEVTVGTTQVYIRTAESFWTSFPVRTIHLRETEDGLLALDFLDFD